VVCLSFLSERGQFFSPDLIIAFSVFIFGLILFFSASNSIFSQVDLLDERKSSDEVAHAVLNSLVLSSGEPSNWDLFEFGDVNAYGLSYSPNMLDKSKVTKLLEDLNGSNYFSIKEKLGFGPYDFYLRLIDSSGSVVFDGNFLQGGVIVLDPNLKLVYQRIVYYEGEQVVLEGIVSLGE
jgi:hypothetical protein